MACGILVDMLSEEVQQQSRINFLCATNRLRSHFNITLLGKRETQFLKELNQLSSKSTQRRHLRIATSPDSVLYVLYPVDYCRIIRWGMP